MKILDNGVNDVRIIGSVALAVMIVICAVGMEWEIKAQNFLLAIIVAAIINFIVGCIIGPNSEKPKAQGFVGFNRMCPVKIHRNFFVRSICMKDVFFFVPSQV